MAEPTGHIDELRKRFPALDDFEGRKLLGGIYRPGGLDQGQLATPDPVYDLPWNYPDVVIWGTTPDGSGQFGAGGAGGSWGGSGPGKGSGESAYFGEGDSGDGFDFGWDWGTDGEGDPPRPYYGPFISGTEHAGPWGYENGDSDLGGATAGTMFTGGLGWDNIPEMVYRPYTVRNNSDYTIYYKGEFDGDATPIPPGGTITVPIDGLNIGGTVIKFVDGYNWVSVTNTGYTTNYSNTGDIFEQAFFGGWLMWSPDQYWDQLFDAIP